MAVVAAGASARVPRMVGKLAEFGERQAFMSARRPIMQWRGTGRGRRPRRCGPGRDGFRGRSG